MKRRVKAYAISISVTLVSNAIVAGAADYYCKGLAGSASSAADERLVEQTLAKTIPMERRAKKLPAAALGPLATRGATAGTPGIVGAAAATVATPPKAPKSAGPVGTAPENYGNNPFGSGNNKNTIYHYTDNRVDTELMDDGPYRRAGHFTFISSQNGSFRCSAALIKRSILVTAGHCVHEGGSKAIGWIKSGSFYPGFNNNNAPYGFANAKYVCTTVGWYNTGNIQAGYDVGLVVLHKRNGTGTEIGAYTGTFGFCHTSCLHTYWYLTQLGYPANYDGGTLMQEGQHLETNRDNTDYYYGSGMQGGSSGGPHVANLGTLSDSTSQKGLYSSRNIVFAVTSWGYVSDIYKIQGASTTSGPANANKFKAMFNAACAYSRSLHGAGSCTNI